MMKKTMNTHKFYIWFTPLVLVFVGYTFYLMTQSYIPYKLGISHWFDKQNQISINTADVYEKGSAYVILEMKPGETVTAKARIKNFTKTDVKIDWFTLDAVENISKDESGFILKSQTAVQNKVAKWISLPVEIIELPKGTEEIIEYTIKVPEKTELGDYAGGIVIQKMPENSTKTNEIRIAIQYALRVYIKVTDEPNQPMYHTWEQRIENADRMFLIHMGIVTTNLILLITLYLIYSPRNKKNTSKK